MRDKKFIIEKSNYPDQTGTHLVIMHSSTQYGENYQRVFKGSRKECVMKKKELETLEKYNYKKVKEYKKTKKKEVSKVSRPTHETRLLEYLQEHKTITSLEATLKLHNTRISATVYNLRKKGYNIATELTSGVNVYGDKTEYATYRLLD